MEPSPKPVGGTLADKEVASHSSYRDKGYYKRQCSFLG